MEKFTGMGSVILVPVKLITVEDVKKNKIFYGIMFVIVISFL